MLMGEMEKIEKSAVMDNQCNPSRGASRIFIRGGWYMVMVLHVCGGRGGGGGVG